MPTATIFDVDEFVNDCRAGLAETDSRRAIRDVVRRVMINPGAVADVLKPETGGLRVLHHAPDLTVLHLVWAPGMRISPHNHGMWATIGIYAGQEDNTFYRPAVHDRHVLVESGGRQLRAGDVVSLGDNTIHAVANPTGMLTGTIHVYGGDLVHEPRSQWGPGQTEERPFNLDESRQQFADANRAWLEASVR